MRWDGSYKVVSLLGSELDLKSLKIFIFLYFYIFGLLLLLICHLNTNIWLSNAAESYTMEAVGDSKERR